MRRLSLLLTSTALSLLPALAAAQTQFGVARGFVAPNHKLALYNCRSGDVDGDGYVDLIYACDYSGIVIYMNDGQGGFTDETKARLQVKTSWASYDVAVKDLDGDGDLDLVVANDHFLPNHILINDGNGKFTDESFKRLPKNRGWTTGLAVFDVDSDGDLDIWFHNWQQADSLFLNKGKGVFVAAPSGSIPTISSTYKPTLETGDLDGDGDLDILIEDSQIQILINDGKGRFAHSKTLSFPKGASYRPWIRDLNGDGRADVYFAGGYKLFIAQAKGGFKDMSKTLLPGFMTNGPSLVADVDMDGDGDLVGSSGLLLNDGKGRFTNVTSARIPTSYTVGYRALALDLDDDGDLDLFGPDSKTILVNHDTQLAGAASPRLGKIFILESHSQPGYGKTRRAVLPLLGFQQARIPLGSFGVLRIFPIPIFELPGQLIPMPSGKATLRLPIPTDTSWKSRSLFFQAATLYPSGRIRLGNLVQERIR